MNRIQLLLSKGYEVPVRKIGTDQIMTATSFAMVDTGTTLEEKIDLISCVWTNSYDHQYRGVFSVDVLELV